MTTPRPHTTLACELRDQADFDEAESVFGAGSYTRELMREAADTIDTLRAQLAEAQKDAERYDYLRKHSTFFDPSQNDTSFLREPPRRIWYHETPHIGADTLDAAIDAEKGESNA